jgi:hypothetical protein
MQKASGRTCKEKWPVLGCSHASMQKASGRTCKEKWPVLASKHAGGERPDI